MGHPERLESRIWPPDLAIFRSHTYSGWDRSIGSAIIVHMAKATMTPTEYEVWLQAFREIGPKWREVAAYIREIVPTRGSCSHHLAKRAWVKGWPRQGDYPPICQIIEAETERAKAEIAKKTRLSVVQDAIAGDKDAQALAHEYQVRARAEEGILVGKARNCVNSILDSSTKLLVGIDKLSNKVSDKLANIGQCTRGCDEGCDNVDHIEDISADAAITLLWRASTAIRAAVAATKDCVEIERLVLNQPTSITEHRVGASATTSESIAHIERNYVSIQRFKDRLENKDRLKAELAECEDRDTIVVECDVIT